MVIHPFRGDDTWYITYENVLLSHDSEIIFLDDILAGAKRQPSPSAFTPR